MVNVHGFNEIWIIDHSTSSAEASGHNGGNSGKGGDLLFRWGNPQAYDAGTSADQKLYGQHDATWIDAGFPGSGDILFLIMAPGDQTVNIQRLKRLRPQSILLEIIP